MHLRFARDDDFHDGWDNERLEFSRSNRLLADKRDHERPVDPLGRKFGMNRTDTDDRQLLLNILHWLSRVDG
jgi:hypothetical protein